MVIVPSLLTMVQLFSTAISVQPTSWSHDASRILTGTQKAGDKGEVADRGLLSPRTRAIGKVLAYVFCYILPFARYCLECMHYMSLTPLQAAG